MNRFRFFFLVFQDVVAWWWYSHTIYWRWDRFHHHHYEIRPVTLDNNVFWRRVHLLIWQKKTTVACWHNLTLHELPKVVIPLIGMERFHDAESSQVSGVSWNLPLLTSRFSIKLEKLFLNFVLFVFSCLLFPEIALNWFSNDNPMTIQIHFGVVCSAENKLNGYQAALACSGQALFRPSIDTSCCHRKHHFVMTTRHENCIPWLQPSNILFCCGCWTSQAFPPATFYCNLGLFYQVICGHIHFLLLSHTNNLNFSFQ